MHNKRIETQTQTSAYSSSRPQTLDDFIGQEETKRIVRVALASSKTAGHPLGHILLSGESGFGKTTLAQLIATERESTFHQITGYALHKPADLISLLHTLQPHDVLFIDEIHRLKAPLEEVLYIAMEDYCVDMVLPDSNHIRLPVAPFTLIGATTKPESLSIPLKNRFIYKFHLHTYTTQEIYHIIQRYMNIVDITAPEDLLPDISNYVVAVPREIANFCRMIKDFLITHIGGTNAHVLTEQIRQDFLQRSNSQKGGLTPLHLQYLLILEHAHGRPVGLKTIATNLGLHPHAVEEDLEPLLFKLQKIEKTPQGRILIT